MASQVPGIADRTPWSSIPTELLLAELQRRGDDPPRPECGSRDRGWYDTAAHIFAVFLILFLSTLSCALPLLSRRTATGHRRKTIIFYCQHVGTGVLLATAFVHLLPMAFESLTDPCLPYFFSEGYTPLPGFVAMVSAIIVTGIESFLTARGAGHSHSHVHDLWDGSDNGSGDADGFTEIPLQEGIGFSVTRPGGRRPRNLDIDDVDASHSLVADASPMPDTTPTAVRANGKSHNRLDQDFDDDDSDLDLDIAELDPEPADDSSPYASLNPLARGTSARNNAASRHGEPETPKVQSPEEQKRQILQCVLLEAGILFHSIFIGMAISVATGPAFVVFLIAISFHQSFEGLALGSRIAAIQFPSRSVRPWLMVLAYGLTTPIGQVLGLIMHRMYDPRSMAGLLVVGFMNAISSGLLLYAGLVQLLAEDFLTEKSYKTLMGRKRLHAYLAVCLGAIMMAIVGAFA